MSVRLRTSSVAWRPISTKTNRAARRGCSFPRSGTSPTPSSTAKKMRFCSKTPSSSNTARATTCSSKTTRPTPPLPSPRNISRASSPLATSTAKAPPTTALTAMCPRCTRCSTSVAASTIHAPATLRCHKKGWRPENTTFVSTTTSISVPPPAWANSHTPTIWPTLRLAVRFSKATPEMSHAGCAKR